ncbi:hypothetical protein D3C72_487170 [compost metagenome]
MTALFDSNTASGSQHINALLALIPEQDLEHLIRAASARKNGSRGGPTFAPPGDSNGFAGQEEKPFRYTTYLTHRLAEEVEDFAHLLRRDYKLRLKKYEVFLWLLEFAFEAISYDASRQHLSRFIQKKGRR